MKPMVGYRFVKDSFDELMYDVLMEMSFPDYVCKPRGTEVREVLVPRLILSDPRNRLLSSKVRKSKYAFAVGEFLWYWRGSNSLEEMTYYNKRMPQFSDDGKTVVSAYGHIIHGMAPTGPDKAAKVDQWKICINTLKSDKDSRRAVLQIHQPVHQFNADTEGSKDVPCTLSLQFFIRENKLHLHVNMRSNDVHWGLTYDLFSFTLFQECMLLELKKHYPDLELGLYYHTTGSLHVYDRHYELSEKMLNEHRQRYAKWIKDSSPKRGKFTEPMAPLSNLEELDILITAEECLRTGALLPKSLPVQNETLLWMFQQLVEHKEKRDKESV